MSNKLSGGDLLFCALSLCATMIIGAKMFIDEKQLQEKQKQELRAQQNAELQNQYNQIRLQEEAEHREHILDSLILDLDTKMDSAYWVIDSLQTIQFEHVLDSVQKNKNIVRRHDIQQELERLYRNNERQIEKARKIAKAHHPYIENIPDNEDVFYKFFHDSAVKVAHNKYKKNNRRIENLSQEYSALPRQDVIYKNIAHYFDSLTNSQVRQQLGRIDSLLNEKNKIITQKIR